MIRRASEKQSSNRLLRCFPALGNQMLGEKKAFFISAVYLLAFKIRTLKLYCLKY